MNYLEYYCLSQEPFSNAPVNRLYFSTKQHEQALLRLRRVADEMKGLGILVGEIGAGKTTLARKMLESLPEDKYEAALLVIIHSGIDAKWLLKRIAQQLGVLNPAAEKLQLLSQLYRRLLQIANQGKKAIVLIDEAQMLQTKELMEEFRGLLNLEVPEKKLISFIFFGLPEIEDNLRLDPPLLQRVALRWRLGTLDPESVQHYIDHRLRLVGSTKPIFEPEAIEAIYSYSGGSPRLINTLADNALFEGFILKSNTIPKAIVENIASDLGLSQSRKRELRLVDAIESKEISTKEASFDGIVEIGTEKSPEPVFERESKDDPQDIDSILAGLEEKM